MPQTVEVSAKQFSFYLPVSLVSQVRAYAAKNDTSASEAVARFVKDALAEESMGASK